MKLYTLTIVIALISSCDYITDLKKTGDIIIVEETWNGAENIEIWAPCRIILTNSNQTGITIEGMDFIVNGYIFEKTDNKLIIKHNNLNHLQEEKIADIILSAPQFRNITANSPCKIGNRDTLQIENFKIVVNGKGIYTTSQLTVEGAILNITVYGGVNKSRHSLRGNVDKAIYHIEGGTDIEALNLFTNSTQITHRSYGNCHVKSKDQLNVTVFSTGSVFYSGTPEIAFKREENTLMVASGNIFEY